MLHQYSALGFELQPLRERDSTLASVVLRGPGAAGAVGANRGGQGQDPELAGVFEESAVILHEGRVLLERSADSGQWGLPGGSVEIGETVTVAIVREVGQETGFDVEDRGSRGEGGWGDAPTSN